MPERSTLSAAVQGAFELPATVRGIGRVTGITALAATGLLWAACNDTNHPLRQADEPQAVIIDTDAGADDLMALAFLLASPGVHIEGITVGTGLAHVGPGARNVLRLLQVAGRSDIPVCIGRSTPLAGGRAFPQAWRALTDELPGVDLPTGQRPVQEQSAVNL